MAKASKIYTEAKISKNFNTVTTGIEYQLKDGEDPILIAKNAHDECRKISLEKLNVILQK